MELKTKEEKRAILAVTWLLHHKFIHNFSKYRKTKKYIDKLIAKNGFNADEVFFFFGNPDIESEKAKTALYDFLMEPKNWALFDLVKFPKYLQD